MKTTLKKVYVSFEGMERAFNKVRRELEGLGLLFAGSRLDKVDCYYEGLSLGGLAGCVGIFKEAFGASYGEKKVFKGEDWSDEYVSEYASSMTQEDFAETFMLYLKHKGKMPARYSGKRAIAKKWRAVARIVREIAALGK